MTRFPSPLRGIVPPLVTPLTGRDALDGEGLEKLIAHVLAGGVHGLFLLGSTGEGPGLSGRLRRELVGRACRLVDGRVPVLVGVSDTSFEETLGLARHAAECGADAVVATVPYYFPLRQPEVVGWFTALAAELPLPLFLYNMPALTKTVIEPETVRRLMDERGIAGIKDSSGDLAYFAELLALAPARAGWSVFMGREERGVDAVRRGAHGVVPGGANLRPSLQVEAYAAATAGETARADQLQHEITRLAEAVFTLGSHGGGFIQGLKAALALAGLCDDALALPFGRLSEPERAILRERLTALGLLPEAPSASA